MVINKDNLDIDPEFKAAIDEMIRRHLDGDNGDLVATYAGFNIPVPTKEGFQSSWIYGDHPQSWVLVDIETKPGLEATVTIYPVNDDFVYYVSLANGEDAYRFAIRRQAHAHSVS